MSHSRWFLFVQVVLLCVLAVGVSALEEEHQPDPPYDGPCIGSNDPYCSDGGDGDAGDPTDCYKCETGNWPGIGTAQVCVRVSSGGSGRSVCDDGLLFSYCDLSGAFCSVITVTP